MDISKIIDDTIYKCAHETANGQFKSDFKADTEDKTVLDMAKQNGLMMNYCNSLLEAYHKELSASLATQGIHI